MSDYTTCRGVNLEGRVCGIFFKVDPQKPDSYLCPICRTVVSPDHAQKDPELKSLYIQTRNAEYEECSKLTIEQIDVRVAEFEAEIEKLRAKILTARGAKADKVSKLTEEEREQLRKIKYEKPADGNVVTAKRETAKAKLAATIKSNPVLYFMQTLKFPFEDALDFCKANGLKVTDEMIKEAKEQ